MATKNNACVPLSLTKGHRWSSRYILDSNSTFFVAFVSQIYYINFNSTSRHSKKGKNNLRSKNRTMHFILHNTSKNDGVWQREKERKRKRKGWKEREGAQLKWSALWLQVSGEGGCSVSDSPMCSSMKVLSVRGTLLLPILVWPLFRMSSRTDFRLGNLSNTQPSM